MKHILIISLLSPFLMHGMLSRQIKPHNNFHRNQYQSKSSHSIIRNETIVSTCLQSAQTQQRRNFADSLKPFLIIPQQKCAVVQRLGKYNRTMKAGLNFKWPLIESTRPCGGETKIDLREQVHDLPKQSVITRDNVEMSINGVVYYRIEDPEKALYEIDYYPNAIQKLSLTTLRNIIGSMFFDETLTSRDQINKTLCKSLDGSTDKWGIEVTRVELQEITPPRDILRAMEQQMTAERSRRALVTEAEGKREAMTKNAEGESFYRIKLAEAQNQATILEAQAAAQSRTLRANAEAEALKVIANATKQDAADYLKAIEYIRMLPELTKGKDDKLVIVPTELSGLAGLVTTIKSLAKSE